jgi:hypothetical protein
MNCTIRNFIDGCILDAHPLAVLLSVTIALGVLAILSLCIAAFVAPPMSYFELKEMKKQKENRDATL